MCVAEEGVLTPSTDQATCEDYRRIVADQGLALETLASGMSWAFSPTDTDPAVRKKAIALHQGALQRAAWLGCSAMLFVPGAVKIPWDPGFGPVPYDKAVAWAREAIEALLPVAEACGVDLCIENVWNGLFYFPLEFAAFIDSFDHPRLGIYFDVGNVLGYLQHPHHWIRHPVATRVFLRKPSDNSRPVRVWRRPRHPQTLSPGDDAAGWKRAHWR